MNITVLADASFCPDHKVGGYGFWIASARGKVGGGAPFRGRISTNICAEMMAVCNAVHKGAQLKLIQHGDILLVQTDCMAAIDAFTGIRNNLCEQEIEAKRYMISLIDRLKLRVHYKHVKGHTGRRESRFVSNEICDSIARTHMQEARNRAINNKEQKGEQPEL